MNKKPIVTARTYCASDYYRNNYIKASIFFLICIGVVLLASIRSNSISRVVPIIVLFVLFEVIYGLFLLKAKKSFSVITLSEQEILVKCPTGEQIIIPWDEKISVGSYYAEMNVSLSGGNHYELILSSTPLPLSYKGDHIEQFSVQNYLSNGSWRVSLGRGSKKWCEKEAVKIMSLRTNANK